MAKPGELSTKRHKRIQAAGPRQPQARNESASSDSQEPASKPVSLRPLKFEEAVRDLMMTRKNESGNKKHANKADKAQ